MTETYYELKIELIIWIIGSRDNDVIKKEFPTIINKYNIIKTIKTYNKNKISSLVKDIISSPKSINIRNLANLYFKFYEEEEKERLEKYKEFKMLVQKNTELSPMAENLINYWNK